MDDFTRLHLNAMLERDEGRRRYVYLDCCGLPWRQCTCVAKGFLTIGVGHNLEATPMNDAVIDLLRDADASAKEQELVTALPWITKLDPMRYAVMLDMAFNLGVAGLLEFTHMLAAVEAGEWEKAADAMRDSRWAAQVGARATRLERQMLTGAW